MTATLLAKTGLRMYIRPEFLQWGCIAPLIINDGGGSMEYVMRDPSELQESPYTTP